MTDTFTASDVILVTGASSGLGKACALELNRLGAFVLAGGRDMGRLEAARREANSPDTFFPVARDLANDLDALPAWVRDLSKMHGKMRGLLCGAGICDMFPLQAFDTEKAMAMYRVNTLAPIMLARGFADRRVNAGRGAALVFIASAAACYPSPAMAAYAASKGALLAAAKTIAGEVAAQGIRVNCISPGIVDTPMAQAGAGALADERARYPFGIGKPEDIAAQAAFLLSAGSGWITGQNVIMDGARYTCLN